MPRPATTALIGGVLSALLLAPLTAAPAAAEPVPAPGAIPVLPDAAPEEALDRVEELFADGVGGPGGGVADPEAPVVDLDVTLALQDLREARDELSARDRAAADSYLARPTDRTGAFYDVEYDTREAAPTCDANVCVHRVGSTADAATQRYAQRVLQTVAGVHDTYVGAGYRAPRKDRAAPFNGGDARTDVYLADIGDKGIYGYCASDDPSRNASTWAYCVLDNDYRPGQYSAHTPRENLQVTVAHEYFHAVQFGYDAFEDPWLMEGTATWVEDETFDAVDDNVTYLRFGPMGAPGRAMDLDKAGFEVYGAWSFWRFLTERYPTEQGGLPTLVRDVWEQADSTADDTTYSLEALERVLVARGTSVRAEFADYAAANRFPAQRYDEGLANDYPRARLADERTLNRKQRTYSTTRRLEHLSAATVRLEPAAGLRSARWKLAIRADLPGVARGSELRVSVVDAGGTATTRTVTLDQDGEASLRRPFSSGRVQAVEVNLVNASTRIRYCGGSGAVSCGGFARDDDLPVSLTATLRAR